MTTMDTLPMDKAERLALLKRIGRQQEQADLNETVQPGRKYREDVVEVLGENDAFREEIRDRRSGSEAINSDEA